MEPVVKYTRKDLLAVREFLAPNSALGPILSLVDYDPDKFCEYIKGLKKEWTFIFNTPLSALPLTINDPTFEGWRKWRFTIGK